MTLLALFDHFAGMADLARPRHVADVQQAVDPFFDFDEGAVVGEIANRAFDQRADRIAVGHFVPGVLLGLLHAERNFVLFLVDFQHDDIHFVVDVHQFVGMADALGPRHFADVHQALDAFFQLHEGAVAHHVHDRALVRRADRVLGFDIVPRAGGFLLEAQGDLFALAIDVQNLHFDFLIDGDHFRRDGRCGPSSCR